MPALMSTPPAAPPVEPVTVERTDTGQFLLRHPDGATALADSLDGAWQALMAQAATVPPPMRPVAARTRRWVLVLAVALPVVWLVALYLALGSVKAEVAGVEPDAARTRALEARIGALEAEVARLGGALEAARADAERAEAAPAPRPTPPSAGPSSAGPPSAAPPSATPPAGPAR